MALSIGIVPGSKIKVGNSVIRVDSVMNSNLVGLSLDGGPVFMVSDNEKTEVMPQVMVSCGVKAAREASHMSRLAFDAPRSISINRIEEVHKVETRVQRILRTEGISQTELDDIAARSAINSKEEGFNRKYHQWLLLVIDGQVRDMERTDVTEVGKDRGKGFVFDEHEVCDGQGCKDCGWRGEVKQWL